MITLTRATPNDIPFIMSAESRPGYDAFVGQWPHAQHCESMSDPNTAYLLGAHDGDAPQGFAMIRELNEPNGSIYLKRIAVIDAGHGFGQPFLAAVTGWVFRETHAHRFWLDVVEDNVRARHVYEKLGFVEEGRKRETYLRPDGSRGSHRLMAILRPEWKARTKV